MKKITRVMAWLYIIVPLLIPMLLALLAAGAITWSLFPKSIGDSSAAVFVRLAGTGTGMLAIAWGAIVLVFVMPWIFLLKKQAWAWWVLVVWFSLGTLFAVAELATNRHFDVAVPFALITLVILLIDHPWNWKGKSRATTRRRKSSPRRRRRSRSRQSR